MLSQELQAAVLGQRVTGCFSTVAEGTGQHKVNSYSRTALAAEGRRKVAQAPFTQVSAVFLHTDA